MNIVKRRADLPRSGEIFIFGAGNGGRIVWNELRGVRGANVAGFVDNAKTGMLCGLPILSIDEFTAMRTERSRVVIATMFGNEVAAQLRELGVEAVDNAYPLITEILSRGENRSRRIKATMTVLVVVWLLYLLFA